MEVHSDEVIAAGSLQHVGDQLGRDRCSTLVLLVLSGIGEVREDGRDATGAGGSAGMDHDQELHQAVVDVVGCRGLQDKDIFVSHGFTNCDGCFLIRIVEGHGLCDLDAEPACKS